MQDVSKTSVLKKYPQNLRKESKDPQIISNKPSIIHVAGSVTLQFDQF